MGTRILTALLLIAIFLPLFIIGGPLTYLMVGIVGIMCMYELTSLRHHAFPKWVRYLIILMATILCLTDFSLLSWSFFMVMVILFVIAIIVPSFTLEDVALYTMLTLFLSLAGFSVIKLANVDGMYLIYISSITFSVDSGAYFAGRFFGKHKLNERISPKKTVEGSIGGFLLGVIVSIAFSFFVPNITSGIMGAFVYGIGLSIFGQIGDLIFSLIKRHYDVKDYGSLLPGHGGMLDRIDSLLLNFCMFVILTEFLMPFISAL